MLRLNVLLPGAALLVASIAGSQGTPVSKLANYRSWSLVTPEAVDMTPAIAMSCIGPSSWDQSPNPHTPRMFKVYVTPNAKQALRAPGERPFPVGSMIVKEKFVRPKGADAWSPVKLPTDAKPELLTAMVKRAKGFDPVNGDWEFLVLSGDGKKSTSEGLKHCGSCHQSRKAQGYVFGNYGQLVRGSGL